jgi:polyisoprenoid-binding protein YceI
MLRSSIIFLIFFTPLFAFAKTTRFDMRDGLQRNVVHFVADAMLERIVGLSTALWGWVELDPENVGKGVKGELEMDMRTFETGIPARNQQIREKIFLANENPTAKFTIKRLIRTPKKSMLSLQPITAEVEGELSFRGVAMAEKVPLKLTFMTESEKTKQRLPGNLLRAQATVTLDLGKYQIEIPDAWHLRFPSRVEVNLDAIGSDQSPAGAVATLPPEGPKPKERLPQPSASPAPSPLVP